MEVVLSSKSYIPYFVYVLMGHGNIIQTKYVQLDMKQYSYTINIKPTIEMVPQTLLSVHYIDKGSFNYCDIKIDFNDNALENKVSYILMEGFCLVLYKLWPFKSSFSLFMIQY